MPAQELIWVHDDAIDPRSLAHRLYPYAPSVYVFDAPYVEQHRWTLRRIAFLYECLLDIPNLLIRRGAVAAEVVQAAQRLGATKVVALRGTDPRWERYAAEIARHLPLEWVTPESFLQPLATTDLLSPARYWAARQHAAPAEYAASLDVLSAHR